MPTTQPVFSTLGWAYIGISAGWTLLLVGGMAFLHRHRSLPFLAMRRLPLVFWATILLHIYALATMIGLTIGPMLPCDAQFWIMSIYLPFGMALLQIANSQFGYVARQQKKYAEFHDINDPALAKQRIAIDPSWGFWKRTVTRVRNVDEPTRGVIYVGLGMALQLLLIFVIYFGDGLFKHGLKGLWNVQVPGTEQQKTVMCLVGWEWWLSILWQVFWSWAYAPYMLWTTRRVHDTHGWKVQTWGCCIAGLFPTPLWLAALYSPTFAPVNTVWIPPQWFALSIFFIEVFVIFFPCYQVLKTHRLHHDTLQAISAWEKRNQAVQSEPESFSASSTLGRSILSAGAKTAKSNTASVRTTDSALTLTALETTLRQNPQPLLEYAALKDFSGENVSFLIYVNEWAEAWPRSSHQQNWIRALQIYSHFISLEYSDFPINISSRTAKDLHVIFFRAADKLNQRCSSLTSDSSTVSPFDDTTLHPTPCSEAPARSDSNASFVTPRSNLEATLGRANLEAATQMELTTVAKAGDNPRSEIPPHEFFGRCVFDEAVAHIKHLVLVNTWAKFVNVKMDAHFQDQDQNRKEERRGSGSRRGKFLSGSMRTGGDVSDKGSEGGSSKIFEGARRILGGFERLA